jgi:hypothetical protein
VTIKDPAGLAWFVCHRSLMLLGQELTEILSENKKIMAREKYIVPRTMSCIIKDLRLSNDKHDALPLH